MPLLSKSDLKYKYSWTALESDDPRVTGKPDSTLLNREEGYEVLPFINHFAKNHNLKKKESGLKTERLIKSIYQVVLEAIKTLTNGLWITGKNTNKQVKTRGLTK